MRGYKGNEWRKRALALLLCGCMTVSSPAMAAEFESETAAMTEVAAQEAVTEAVTQQAMEKAAAQEQEPTQADEVSAPPAEESAQQGAAAQPAEESIQPETVPTPPVEEGMQPAEESAQPEVAAQPPEEESTQPEVAAQPPAEENIQPDTQPQSEAETPAQPQNDASVPAQPETAVTEVQPGSDFAAESELPGEEYTSELSSEGLSEGTSEYPTEGITESATEGASGSESETETADDFFENEFIIEPEEELIGMEEWFSSMPDFDEDAAEIMPVAADAAVVETAKIKRWTIGDLDQAAQKLYDQEYRVYPAGAPKSNTGNYPHNYLEHATDGNETTFWETGQTNTDTLHSYLEFQFAEPSEIARVVYAPRTSGKGFPLEFEIWASQTDEGEDFLRVAKGSYAKTAAFLEISFAQQSFKRLRFVFMKSDANFPSCREIAFYKEDVSDDIVEHLFLDYCRYTLDERYRSIEALETLRAQLQTNVKYEGTYKALIDRAEKIVNKELVFQPEFELSTNPAAANVIERNGDVVSYARKTLRFNSFVTNRQVCGIAAYTGDQITVYVEAPEGDPLPKIRFSQAYGYWSCWLGGECQLQRGVNTFTVPNFKIAGANYASYDIASGGAIYIVNPYTAGEQSENVKIYIEGGDSYPVYRKGGNEAAYRKQLTAYADRVRDDSTAVVDLTELVCDHAIMTVSATRADEIYDTKSPKANLEKWDEVLHETLAFQGIQFDPSDPYYSVMNEHLNVNYRVSQVWDGGFMFAYTEHIGLYGRNNGEDLLIYCMDAAGRPVMGWGCIHEMGHMVDLPDRTIGETTNNMPANFVNTYYAGEIRNENYIQIANSLASDRTWKNDGFNQNRYNYMVFFLLESYYRGYWGDTDNIYRYADNGQCADMSKTEKQIYFSSLAAGVDLGYYFERWGYCLTESEGAFTRAGASQAYRDAVQSAINSGKIKTDERPIWYLDSAQYSYMRDYGDLSTGAGGMYSLNNKTQIVRVLKTSDGYSITLPTHDNNAHLGYEIWEGTEEKREIIGFTHSNSFTDTTQYADGYTPTYWAVAYDRLLQKTAMSDSANATSDQGVCELDGVRYDSLSQAAAAAQDGAVIYLVKDIIDSGVTVNKKLTFMPKDSNVTIKKGGNSAIFRVIGTGALTLQSSGGYTLTLDGDSLVQSHALVEADENATFTLKDIRMTGSVDRSFGGGVRVSSASVRGTLTNVTFAGNTAMEGGALYNVGTVTLTDCVFEGNTAISAGGAICNTKGGVCYLNNGSISGGRAAKGGAIYGNGRTDLNNVAVRENSADLGGAIYFRPDNGARSLNLAKGTVVENNEAKNGSFLYLMNNGNANINDAVIKKHTAQTDAFDIYSDTGNLTIDGRTADLSAAVYKKSGSIKMKGQMLPKGNLVITLAGYTTAEAVVNTDFAMREEDIASVTLADSRYSLQTGEDGKSAYIRADRKVTLHANGGTIKSGNLTGYVQGEFTALPTNVVKDGCTFAGWFENEALTGASVKSIKPEDDGDKEYYAKWRIARYNIKYVTNGGRIQGYLTNNFYDVTMHVELPMQIQREGCDFLGWYDNKEFTGSTYTELPEGTTGNFTFYAKWTCLPDEEKKVENEREATCTSGPSYDLVTYCVDCEAELERETIYTGDPLGHTFGAWSVTKEALCEAGGVETRVCSVCGEQESRSTMPAGHTFVDGTCSVCGKADPSLPGGKAENPGEKAGDNGQSETGGQPGAGEPSGDGGQNETGGQPGAGEPSGDGGQNETGSQPEMEKQPEGGTQANESNLQPGNEEQSGSSAQTESEKQTTGKKQTASQKQTGSKKQTAKPYIKLNYKTLPLQKGKKTTVVKIQSASGNNRKIKSARSSRPSIASVKVSAGKLTITAKKVGITAITVTGANKATARLIVTVKRKVQPTKVTLNRKSVVLKKGKRLKLTATITPVTAVTTHTWTSSNKKVATVTSTGWVTAKKKGRVTITYRTKNGKKATCKITIR